MESQASLHSSVNLILLTFHTFTVMVMVLVLCVCVCVCVMSLHTAKIVYTTDILTGFTLKIENFNLPDIKLTSLAPIHYIQKGLLTHDKLGYIYT